LFHDIWLELDHLFLKKLNEANTHCSSTSVYQYVHVQYHPLTSAESYLSTAQEVQMFLGYKL